MILSICKKKTEQTSFFSKIFIKGTTTLYTGTKSGRSKKQALNFVINQRLKWWYFHPAVSQTVWDLKPDISLPVHGRLSFQK